MHDPGKFDKEGKALDPALKPFIHRAMFHAPESYDYAKIRCNWHAPEAALAGIG